MSGIFDQITNYSPSLISSGQVVYKGTWNAATNTPTLLTPPAATSKGNYYVVSAIGTQFGISFAIGDWIISNGTSWEKVDLTDAVSSVHGRTGAVIGVSTDYSAVGITNTAIGATLPSTGAFTTGTFTDLVTVKKAANFSSELRVSDTTSQGTGALILGDGIGLGKNVGVWRGASNSYSTVGNYLNLGGYDGVTIAVGNAALGSQTLIGSFSSTGLAVTGALSATGNIGIGVTPSASWFTGSSVLQFGAVGALWTNGSNNTAFSHNAVFGNTSTTYLTTAAASYYRQISGAHNWFTAPSGTAGNAITFTQAMTLDASGRLMIGTTSPQQQLTVSGAGTNDGGLYFNTTIQNATTAATSAPKTGICFQAFYSGTTSLANFAGISGGKENTTDGNASGVLIFSTATSGSSPAERARIDSSGNLLVGTTTSSRKLTVAVPNAATLGANDDGVGVINASGRITLSLTGSTYNYYGIPVDSGLLYSVSRLAIAADSGTPITFHTSGAERARIDSSGNLLVGTTTANSTAANGFGAVQTSDATYLFTNHSSGTSAYSWYHSFGYAGSQIGYIYQSGTTGVVYSTSSDYRLKDITGPLTDSGTFIDALKPKVGTWKSDGSKFVGFIAHEFAEVSPSSVAGEKDAVDSDGKPIYQAMQASSAEVIANLVAELQSVRQRLAALESN